MLPSLLIVAIASVLSTCSAYPLRLETSLWEIADIIVPIVWSITGGDHDTPGLGLLSDVGEGEQGLNEMGWYDPRPNGGQMLDVCLTITMEKNL